MNREKLVQFRCSELEHKRFQLAAQRMQKGPIEEVNLSAFFRALAHEYADNNGVPMTNELQKDEEK